MPFKVEEQYAMRILPRYLEEKIFTQEEIESLPITGRDILRHDWVFVLCQKKILTLKHLEKLSSPALRALKETHIVELIEEKFFPIDFILNLQEHTSIILSKKYVGNLIREGILNFAHIKTINDQPDDMRKKDAYIHLFANTHLKSLLEKKLFTLEELFSLRNEFKIHLDEIHNILAKKLLKKEELIQLNEAIIVFLLKEKGMLFYLLDEKIFTITELNQLADHEISSISVAMRRHDYSVAHLLKQGLLTIQQLSTVEPVVVIHLQKDPNTLTALQEGKTSFDALQQMSFSPVFATALPLLRENIVTFEELQSSKNHELINELIKNIHIQILLKGKYLSVADLEKAQNKHHVDALSNLAVCGLLRAGKISVDQVFKLSPTHLSILSNETIVFSLLQTTPLPLILAPIKLSLEAIRHNAPLFPITNTTETNRQASRLDIHQALIETEALKIAKIYLIKLGDSLDQGNFDEFQKLITTIKMNGFTAIYEKISTAVEQKLFTKYPDLYQEGTAGLDTCFSEIASKIDEKDFITSLQNHSYPEKNREKILAFLDEIEQSYETFDAPPSSPAP